MTNSETNANKREPQFNVPKKTLPTRSMKKQRKYFDSADWMVAGKEYEKEAYPVKSSSSTTKENHHSHLISTSPVEMNRNSNEKEITEEQPKNEEITPEKERQLLNEESDGDSDKENKNSGADEANISHFHSHSHSTVQKNKHDRKYFDSADWALNQKVVPNKTYRSFPQPDPKAVMAKKKVDKSRKYFDSADWALENGKYVPQLYPKLQVLRD